MESSNKFSYPRQIRGVNLLKNVCGFVNSQSGNTGRIIAAAVAQPQGEKRFRRFGQIHYVLNYYLRYIQLTIQIFTSQLYI